jgi:hypothetical protein
MINLQLNKEELNLIIRGLYAIEDMSWFFENKEQVEELIGKLEKHTETPNVAVCDI